MLPERKMKHMTSKELPWKEIYDLAVQCCRFGDVRSFTVSFLQEIRKMVGFDEAIIFYLDVRRKLEDYYLYNINPKWMSLYLNFYSHADRGMYGISQRDLEHLDDVYVHQWKFEAPAELVQDYIRPRNLVSSLGFPLRDAAGNVRTVIAFDRLTSVPFSEADIELIRAVRKLLNPYHGLLFGTSAGHDSRRAEEYDLTARETEILNLLRQGLAPANIAHILHIAVPTANRHIANIYKKLKVNSRGELMAKISNN